MPKSNPIGIEQVRRDFKRDNPDLYQYIVDHEGAKVWDVAGDYIGGNDPQRANYCYHQSWEHTKRKRAAIEETRTP